MEIQQLLLFGFLTAIGLVAYDMRLALRSPACQECAHCRAAQAAVQRHHADVQEFYRRRYTWRDHDDEDR